LENSFIFKINFKKVFYCNIYIKNKNKCFFFLYGIHKYLHNGNVPV